MQRQQQYQGNLPNTEWARTEVYKQPRDLNRNPSNKSYKSFKSIQLGEDSMTAELASKSEQQPTRQTKVTSPANTIIVEGNSPSASTNQIQSDAERLQQYVNDQIRHHDPNLEQLQNTRSHERLNALNTVPRSDSSASLLVQENRANKPSFTFQGIDGGTAPFNETVQGQSPLGQHAPTNSSEKQHFDAEMYKMNQKMNADNTSRRNNTVQAKTSKKVDADGKVNVDFFDWLQNKQVQTGLLLQD